jgi:protein ImuB
MPRLASLFLPQLAIERIVRRERSAKRREKSSPRFRGEGDRPKDGGGASSALEPEVAPPPGFAWSPSPGNPGEEKPGLKPGHWRPGARWAREAAVRTSALNAAEGALVTAHRIGNRDLVAAACPRARALGLAPGMALAKARVLVRGLDVRPADPDGDAAWLARLGLFAARRWTPRAALSGADGLWLDLTGVAHLFGGEENMCRRILAFCRRLGFSARIAIAGTAGAAHALARFGMGRPLILCPPGGEAAAVAAMPLAALRLEEDVLAAADRLGVERIGELIAMPRGPLQRRFGAALLTRLDQALGRAAEPFDPIVPEAPLSILLRFLEPIATAEAIAEAGAEAVRRLIPQLAEAGLGVRRLILICERVDNESQHVVVSTARATRDGPHLHALLCAKIETIEPGFGIERLRLVAGRVEPLAPQPIEGEMAGARPAPDLAVLVDRLAARLGARRVHRLGAVESDLPERSVRAVGPLAAPAAWPQWPRPVRLLSPPEQVDNVMAPLPDGAPVRFNWRGKAYQVAAADGPERVFGEWWRHESEQAAIRDYFQVEDRQGARFWLFRKGDGEDPETGDLSWWLQGIFA